jgi:hypothetical protein
LFVVVECATGALQGDICILMLRCNLLLWFMQLVVEYLISQCMGIYHRFTEPSYMRANG